MLRFRPFLSLVACGWFGIACIVPASAQVKDAGGFFSADAVAKADAKIQEIDRQFNKSILVESVSEIPNDLKPRYEEQGKAKFFSQWAAERAKEAGVKGVYVLLCKQPPHLQIEVEQGNAPAGLHARRPRSTGEEDVGAIGGQEER